MTKLESRSGAVERCNRNVHNRFLDEGSIFWSNASANLRQLCLECQRITHYCVDRFSPGQQLFVFVMSRNQLKA